MTKTKHQVPPRTYALLTNMRLQGEITAKVLGQYEAVEGLTDMVCPSCNEATTELDAHVSKIRTYDDDDSGRTKEAVTVYIFCPACVEGLKSYQEGKK